MTSVLIPDGESTLARHVVYALAADKSIEVHILSKDPNPIIRHSRFIKSFTAYDPNAIGTITPPADSGITAEIDELIRMHHYDQSRGRQLVDVILAHAKKVGANVLMPVDEHIVKILALYKDEFAKAGIGSLLPDQKTFLNIIDKWELSKVLKPGNIPHPDTKLYDQSMDNSVIDSFPFPVIIKPIDQGNALGIRSFQAAAEMKSYFTKHHEFKHKYVVQPLINGYDIDCSVLTENGEVLAYTIQKGIVSGANKFRAATGIQFLDNDEVIGVVRDMMRLVKYSGIAHIDLRYDADEKKIKVIEVNARYWGSLLGSVNAGVNFPILHCRTVRGEKYPLPSYNHARYFMGKSPMKKILTTFFSNGNQRVRLKDTSLYFTVRDLKPFLAEVYRKIRS